MTSTKPGRPKALDPKIHRYSFKLNTEQNARFLQMMHEAGMNGQTSRFILFRLFG